MKTQKNKSKNKSKFVIVNHLDNPVYQTKNYEKFKTVLEVLRRWEPYPVFWTGVRRDEYTVKLDHEYVKKGYNRAVDCEVKVIERNKDHRREVFKDLHMLKVCGMTGAVVWPLDGTETPGRVLFGESGQVSAKVVWHVIPEDIGEVYEYSVDLLGDFSV